jgi:hypothetical protein
VSFLLLLIFSSSSDIYGTFSGTRNILLTKSHGFNFVVGEKEGSEREERGKKEKGGEGGSTYLSPNFVKKSDKHVTAADLTTAVECRVAKQI